MVFITNDIIAQILDIVDPDSKITNFVIEGTVKYVTLTKNSENKVLKKSSDYGII